MTQKKLGPGVGVGDTEARTISSAETERILPTPIAKDSPDPAEFWLHVNDDGTEVRYRHEPDVRALRVVVSRGIETTKTWSIETMDGPWPAIIAVKPRGAGWEIIDDDNDKFSTCQRPARRCSAPTLNSQFGSRSHAVGAEDDRARDRPRRGERHRRRE